MEGKEFNPQDLVEKTRKLVLNDVYWDKNNRMMGGCSICLSVCGLATILFAFVFFITIGSLIHSGVIQNAVVDSQDAPGFSFWESNFMDEASPAEYECYVFYNLTNPYMVEYHQATPVYEEKGPYCYRAFKIKVNVSWSDDGNQVSHSQYTHYQWAPEASFGNSKDDIFTNVCPGYLGILAGTHGEEGLIAGFIGPSLQYNVLWLTHVFVYHIKATNLAPTLTSEQQQLSQNSTDFLSTWANATQPPNSNWEGMLVSYLGTPSGISVDSATALWNASDPYSFVNPDAAGYWFNSTLPPFVSIFGVDIYIPPNNESTNVLMNHFNLTSTQIQMITSWLVNSYYPVLLDPMLIAQYNQIDSGVQTIEDLGWLQWGKCDVTPKTKAGRDQSAAEIYPFRPEDTIPDYGCWSHFAGVLHGDLSVNQSKKLLNGTVGVFSMPNLVIFFSELYKTLSPVCQDGDLSHNNMVCSGCQANLTVCNGDEGTCNFKRGVDCSYYNPYYNPDGPYGNCTYYSEEVVDGTCDSCTECVYNATLNATDPYQNCSDCSSCTFSGLPENTTATCQSCQNTTRCLNSDQWQYINETWGIDFEEAIPFLAYMEYVRVTYSQLYLTYVLFGAGGGLITNRTVDQWLFHQEDPLMKLANPTQPNAGDLIVNQTSVEYAERVPPSLLYTGLNDISQVAHYITWGNLTEIKPPYYAEPVAVEGTQDEWGQFPPFMDENNIQHLTTFDENYIRPVTIIKTGEVKYRDVILWRFMVNNDTLLPNPKYYQSVQGFANSTMFHYGSPIFYSNPHFAGCDETYANKVIGVVEGRNYLSDYTVCDIEPITGLVMHVNETIQLNVYLDPYFWKDSLKVFYPTFPLDIFYPIMWAYESTTMTLDNVRQYRAGVIYSRWLQRASFGVLFVTGLIMMISAVLLFLYIRKNSLENAHHYNEVLTLINDSEDDVDR